MVLHHAAEICIKMIIKMYVLNIYISSLQLEFYTIGE